MFIESCDLAGLIASLIFWSITSARRSFSDFSRIVVVSMLKPGESVGIVAGSWRLPERLLFSNGGLGRWGIYIFR